MRTERHTYPVRLMLTLRATALVLVAACGIASIVASGGESQDYRPSWITPPPMSVFPQRYTFGGETLPVSVRLANVVPPGSTANFTVSTNLPAGTVSLPAAVSIAAGQSELTFNVPTNRVTDFVEGRIDVTWTNYDPGSGPTPITSGQSTTLMPEPTTLQLSFTPNAVPGGQPAALQIAVTPVYPISIGVSLSADSTLVQVPPQLFISGNAASLSAQITTNVTATAQTVNITARLRGLMDVESLLVTTSPLAAPQLTVTVNGAGSVSSSPAGISGCTATCSADYPVNSNVTLTATPAGGSVLVGWSGACTGTATDTAVQMNTSKTCIATFGTQPPPPPPPPPTGWQLVSANLDSNLEVGLSSVVALDANGQAFVGYIQTVGTQGRLNLRREGSGGFEPVLNVNANAGWSATSLDMVIDAAGQPILAYGKDFDSIAAWRWNDSVQQSKVESSRLNLTNSAGSSPQIGIAGGAPNAQTIVVAWVETGQIAVRRYSMASQSWDAGAFIPGIANVRAVRMMLDAGGAPVIAYWSGTLNVIRETAPGVWAALGGAINNMPTDVNGVASFGVHVDAGDRVRVAWAEGIRGSGTWYVYARRFNGTAWVSAIFAGGIGDGLMHWGSPADFLDFPNSVVVARNPNAFAIAVAIEEMPSSHSRLRLWWLDNDSLLVSTIPTIQTGTHMQVRRLSLAMQDVNRPVLTSSHYDPIALPPHLLQVRRYFP